MESLTVRKQMVRQAMLVCALSGAVFLSACAKSGSFETMPSSRGNADLGKVQNQPSPLPQKPQPSTVTPAGAPAAEGEGSKTPEASPQGEAAPAGPVAPAKPSTSEPPPVAPPVEGPSVHGPPSVPAPVSGPISPAAPANPGPFAPPAQPTVSELTRPALPWESWWKPERAKWSAQLFESIRKHFEVLDLANDMERFCPSYNKLGKDDRMAAWAFLIVEIARHESGWDATSRMHEKGLGIDSVTGTPVYSEGLLQLSYQDVVWAPYCEFDWGKDKGLSVKDPTKTILDPYKNLRCGIGILARQIRRNRLIAMKGGIYWAVLHDGGRFSKISSMSAAIRRNFRPCR